MLKKDTLMFPQGKAYDLNLIVLVLTLFFLRMAFPFTNYVFIPCSLFAIGYFFYKYYRKITQYNMNEFVRSFSTFFILAACFLISLAHSGYNNLILKEIASLLLLAVFLFIIFMKITNLNDYGTFKEIFVKQIIIFSSILSFLGIAKFILVLSGQSFLLADNKDFNSSLNSDYNFFGLIAILGIISIIYTILSKPGYKSRLFQILLFIQSLCLFFSGSRRGFIIYILLIFGILLASFSQVKNIYSKTRLFQLLKFSFFLILYLFFAFYNTPLLQHYKRSELNTNFVNHTFFDMMGRYTSLFNIDQEYIEQIIEIQFDPKYPYTRWGTRKHTQVYPIEGLNSEIVPQGSVGYKLDSTCNASSWNGNAYAYTSLNPLFTGIPEDRPNHIFYASVYCYVSVDYDGSRVWLGAENQVTGKHMCIYDTLKKGQWQKLEIEFSYEKGLAPVYMYISKNGVTDFNKLKGYVIFAHPEYKDMQNDTIADVLERSDDVIYFKSSVLNLNFSSFAKRKIINIQSREVNHDEFILKEGGELSIPRYERLRYSLHLFLNEFSLKQKLFGGGFGYMEKFGTKFGSVQFDYPHNPVISSLLFSGILGGTFYLFYLIIGLYYYLKYLKNHLYFFICYLVVFFFSIISANTHFSIPVFTFLSMIPFLTHAIVQKEKAAMSISQK